MQDCLGTWTIRGTITTTAGTPKTAVQYAASATNTAEILYVCVSQNGSTTSAMDGINIIRKTAGATVTIGAVGTNIFDFTGNSTSGAGTFRGTLSTSATGVNATAEGTNGDIIKAFDFNVLAGYEWNAQPNSRIWVPASGIIAVQSKAIIAATYNIEMIIREMK